MGGHHPILAVPITAAHERAVRWRRSRRPALTFLPLTLPLRGSLPLPHGGVGLSQRQRLHAAPADCAAGRIRGQRLHPGYGIFGDREAPFFKNPETWMQPLSANAAC